MIGRESLNPTCCAIPEYQTDSRTMMGPREFHRANSERASRLRQRAAPPVIPLTVPLPSAHDRRDDDNDELEDQLEDELEIMLEMGGGGPPPPDE